MSSTPPGVRYLRWSSALFAVLLLTGLLPLLFPYGTQAQWILLVHIVVGLAVLLPVTRYLWRHLQAAKQHGATRWWAPGYWGWWGWLGASVTGVALTAWGWWGSFTPYTLHWVHVGFGLGLGLLGLWHVIYRLKNSRFTEGKYRALVQAGVLVCVVVLGGIAGIWLARRGAKPAKTSFEPSNAQTANGRAIPVALLKSARSCGQCHQQIYREWLPSAHHYSATDPFYEVVKANFLRARGPAAAQYCAGCHEPVTLLSGERLHAKTTGRDGAVGSSCAFCHLIRDVKARGNANYTVHVPDPYLFELSHNPFLLRVSDLLIRLHPQQHNYDYNVKPSESALFCGTCHKQYISKRVNGWGFVQLQDQYDDWKNGPWPSRGLKCESCHMHRVASNDPARSPHGFIRDHRILASNNYAPLMLHLPGARRQVHLVDQWMRGQTVIPALAGRWPRGPLVPLILRAEGNWKPGGMAALRTLLINAKVGHTFPAGPLDVIEAWLQVSVTDGRGHQVFSVGTLGPEKQIEGKTVEYRAHLLDRHGHSVYTHSLWNVVGARGKRVIMPGGSDTHVFRFPIPAQSRGPLVCRVRFLYRKFNSMTQRLLFPPNFHPPIPVLTISSARLVVPLQTHAMARVFSHSHAQASASAGRRAVSERR